MRSKVRGAKRKAAEKAGFSAEQSALTRGSRCQAAAGKDHIDQEVTDLFDIIFVIFALIDIPFPIPSLHLECGNCRNIHRPEEIRCEGYRVGL